MKTSVDDVHALLRIWAERNMFTGNNDPAVFDDHDHFLEFIDAIPRTKQHGTRFQFLTLARSHPTLHLGSAELSLSMRAIPGPSFQI